MSWHPARAHAAQTPAAGLLVLAALSACATGGTRVLPEPISTDRPDFTESVTTVAQRHTQVEAGMTFSDDTDGRRFGIGEVLLRQGLSSRLELRLAGLSYTIRSTSTGRREGLENTVISAKMALREAGAGPRRWQPAVSVLVGTSVPIGSSPNRSRHALPLVKLLNAWALSDRVELATNVNWTAADDSRVRNQWSGSGSLGVALTERVGVFGEYFAIGTRGDQWSRIDRVDAGLTARITTSWQIDARVGVGPSSARHQYFAGAGFAHRW